MSRGSPGISDCREIELLVVELRCQSPLRGWTAVPPPPGSINNILAGLYRYVKSRSSTGIQCLNFMSRKDAAFRELTGAVQVCCKELRTDGVGAVVKHAAIVTPEKENMLWEPKVLGVHSPLALVCAVFFHW